MSMLPTLGIWSPHGMLLPMLAPDSHFEATQARPFRSLSQIL